MERDPGSLLVRWSALVLISAAALAASSCGFHAAPVGELSIQPAHLRLPYPERTDLQLAWSPTAQLPDREGQLRAFVHLREPDGGVLRTFDHDLPEPWRPGRRQEYTLPIYQSGLGPPLSPGEYVLTVGLYDEGEHRWPLMTSGEQVDRFEYAVGTVEVPTTRAAVPMFTMSTAWQPLEAGDGSQILGRRWLSGAGTVSLTEIQGPGAVWMQFRVPEVREGQESLVHLESGMQPSVRITTDCGPAEEFVSGHGLHRVELPLTLTREFDPELGCTIHFQPSFEVVALDTLIRRSIQLELIAWMRAQELG